MCSCSVSLSLRRLGLPALWLVISYFALALMAAAQTDVSNEPAPPPPAPSSKTHVVSGVVVNSVSGEPVRRALVQLFTGAGTPLSMLSDSEGRFEFASVPESDMTLVARKPGFFNRQELQPEGYQLEVLHLGADTPPVVLNLSPEGVVSGHVTTLKGEPIEDSPVRLMREHVVDGRKRWELRGQTMTDDDGQFHIANLVPGRYLLATGPNMPGIRGLARARSVRQEGFGTVFYPGVPELDSASAITISAGQQAQVDLALKAEPIFNVTGNVIGIQRGTGVSLQFISKSGEALPAPVSLDAETGKFEAAIPAGTYVLQLRGSDASGQIAAADLPVVVNGDVAGVTMALGPAVTVPVNIELRPSGTMPGATAGRSKFLRTDAREQTVSSVRLISTENRIDVAEFQADANKKGALAFHNLVPGQFIFDLTSMAPWYVRSATSGTTDLLREELVVAPGRRPEPIEVVLRDDGCAIHGSIRAGGQPVGGAVLLIPDQTSLAHTLVSTAVAGAEFDFTGIAPGSYKLLAFDTLDGLEFRNSEVLGPYLSKAIAVSLQANEVANVTVDQVSAGK
jgi:hypothetical protein